jgi:FKBP-type peptidyl-prolyl cis-trans isomerase (trigger factor)
MNIKLNKLSKNQIEFEIEVDKEKFDSLYETAVKEAGENIEIKGFRKGKAPQDAVIEKIGTETLLSMTAEDAIKESYMEALKQLEEGKLSDEKLEPISQPEINVVKMAKGDSFVYKATTFIVPEVDMPDYKKVAKGVKKEEIKVTEEEIENLRKQKENASNEKRRQEIITEIVKKTKVEIPSVLVQKEQANMLEGTKRGVMQNLQMSFEDYLAKINKTEEELVESFKSDAEDRIKKYLVLREISKKENVKAEDKEIEAKIEETLKSHPDKEQAKKEIDLEGAKTYYKEVIENEKVFKLLEEL